MQRVVAKDKSKIGFKEHPGLLDSDRAEFNFLQLFNLQDLLNAIDQTPRGNPEELSNATVIIEPTQAKRIEDWLASHPDVPSAWKKKYGLDEETATAADQTPASAARKGQKENRVVKFLQKYW